MGQFMLPDLGEGLEEAQVTRWLVAVGDRVALNQHLCEVETAKALVEIPSPWAGTVQSLHAKPGDTVLVGAPLITIAEEAAAGAEDGEGPVLVGYGAHAPAQAFTRRRRGGGSVARAARARAGSGGGCARGGGRGEGQPAGAQDGGGARHQPGGHRRDWPRRLASAWRTWTPRRPAAPASGACRPLVDSQDEERISTVGLRKAIAAKMVRSATTIPHFTEYGLFDATNLIALRERLKADPALRRAAADLSAVLRPGRVQATRQFPIMNSRWDEENSAIVIKKRISVGIATDTPARAGRAGDPLRRYARA